MRQNPGVASVLSFLFPGLGQIYALQTGKGIAMGIGWIALGVLNFWVTSRAWVEQRLLIISAGATVASTQFVSTIMLTLAGLVYWIWAVFDARAACELAAEEEELVAQEEMASTDED